MFFLSFYTMYFITASYMRLLLWPLKSRIVLRLKIPPASSSKNVLLYYKVKRANQELSTSFSSIGISSVPLRIFYYLHFSAIFFSFFYFYLNDTAQHNTFFSYTLLVIVFFHFFQNLSRSSLDGGKS